MSGQAEASREARAWLDGDRRLPQAPDAWTALAWAIKDLGIAAWYSEPAATLRAAQAAQALALQAPKALQPELNALADWTAGLADLTQGRMSEAISRFDAATAALRVSGRAAEAAQAQVPKMIALSVLGRHAEAAACGDAAQRALNAAGDRLGAAKASQNLGNLHVRRNDYGEALRCYREASVLFARAGERDLSVMADLGAADARAALGEFDEALRLCERARWRAEAHALPVFAAMATESAALIGLARGHYRDALAGLETARARYEALSLPQHLATAEKQLGDAYLELRLLPEAQRLYAQALSRFAALEMPVEAAWTHVQAARALALSGQRWPEVERHLAQALALFDAQEVPLGRSSAQLVRAEQALAAQDGAAALAAADEAGAGFDAAHAADGRLRASLLAAQARLIRGEANAARVAFDACHAQALALGSIGAQAQAASGLGQAAWAAGDPAEAAPAFEAAIEALEWQRAALPDDTLREAFLADQLDPYQGLLRIALAQAEARPGAASAARVLQRLDAYRARTLDDRLRGAAAHAVHDDRSIALRERLDWLYRRALRQREEGEGGSQSWHEIAALEAQLLEHTRRRGFVRAEEAAWTASPRAPLDVEALSERLADGDALIEYGGLDDECFAVVLTRRGARLQRRLARWSAAIEALRALQFQIDTLRSGDAMLQRHAQQLAARARQRLLHLHEMLWQPLRPALQGVARAIVVPHGALAALPFAALHDGTRHLIEGDLVLATAASARVALHGLAHPPSEAPRRAASFGDDQRLPHAGAEADAAAHAYAQGRAYRGAAATLTALRQASADAQVLHLACHGEFRADNPAFSLLHLADGALTVQAAGALALARGSVVVLGACDSARSASGAGDETVGFVRAFMQAGAARVVASLWPIADARSTVPMGLLHRALGRGEGAAVALREAQRMVLRENPHPFHWAGLAVHGGW